MQLADDLNDLSGIAHTTILPLFYWPGCSSFSPT
jgi:hypothetical protein